MVPKIAEFRCTGVKIGGIIPFHYPNIPPTADTSVALEANDWQADAHAAKRFRELRRAVYSPEQRWIDTARIFSKPIWLESLNLTSGRHVNGVSGAAYLLAYHGEVATLIWALDFQTEIFSRSEVIECLALARGTPERINRRQSPYVEVSSKNVTHRFSTMYEWIDKSLIAPLDITGEGAETANRFCYPILYVSDVAGTISAEDTINQFARDISGILNLWIDDTEWLKEREISRSLDLETHPFEYGLNFASVSCTAEFHSAAAIQKISCKEGVSVEAHHEQELIFLLNLCERPVTSLFGLRYYETVLDGIVNGKDGLLPSSFLSVVKLLKQATKLTKLRRSIALAVGNFRSANFTRKSYMRSVFRHYDTEFGIVGLLSSVDQKLGNIENTISNAYSMITTFFGIALTLLGVIFAAASVWIALLATAGPTQPRSPAIGTSGPPAGAARAYSPATHSNAATVAPVTVPRGNGDGTSKNMDRTLHPPPPPLRGPPPA